ELDDARAKEAAHARAEAEARQAAERAAGEAADARARAAAEKQAATQARAQARDAQRLADAQQKKADENAYAKHLALAERAWLNHQAAKAAELLEGCPPALRGWEWHYLKRQSQGSDIPLEHDHVARVALRTAL